jgi:topoisomerase IA-like protein
VSDMLRIPFGDDPAKTATLLLGAADDLEQPREVVGTTQGAFLVSPEIAKKAGLDKTAVDEDGVQAYATQAPADEPKQAPTKKATKKAPAKKAAKKSPAKKAAKKSTAKKSTPRKK